MPAIVYLLTIKIGMDPNIAKFGSLQLTWHGIFTAVGIAAGVYLGAWLGRRQGITEDDAYSVALVGVPAGIIGARAMYVLENHARFSGHWVDVLRINEGGITVYGAVIGGIVGAVAYGLIRKLPITRGLDAAAFGLLLGYGDRPHRRSDQRRACGESIEPAMGHRVHEPGEPRLHLRFHPSSHDLRTDR